MNRFLLEKKYMTRDAKLLTNPENIVKYLKDLQSGALECTFDSSAIPSDLKHSKRIVGTDVERALFSSNQHKSKLLLVTHGNEAKNFGVEAEFDSFAKSNKLKNLQVLHYNGVNESEAFKAPKKLPAIMYFRQGLPLDEEPAILDRNQMLQSLQDKRLRSTLKDFVQKNNV